MAETEDAVWWARRDSEWVQRCVDIIDAHVTDAQVRAEHLRESGIEWNEEAGVWWMPEIMLRREYHHAQRWKLRRASRA